MRGDAALAHIAAALVAEAEPDPDDHDYGSAERLLGELREKQIAALHEGASEGPECGPARAAQRGGAYAS